MSRRRATVTLVLAEFEIHIQIEGAVSGSLQNANDISMTLDTATTRLYGVEARFVEFEPEPGEIIFTEASPEEQKAMVAIIDRIVHEMTTRFPDLKRDLTPKYNKMFQRLEEKQPMLRQLAPITPDELFSFVLAGCCLLAGVGYLLYRRVRT